MNATSSSSITDRPSMCWPMVKSTPPFDHHVHCRMTGWTNGSAWPPSLAAMLRANPAARPIGPALSVPAAASVRWIHW